MTSSDGSSYVTCREFVERAIVFEQQSAAFYRAMQTQCTGAARELAVLLEKQELAHEQALRGLDLGSLTGIIQFVPDLTAAMPDLPATPCGLAEMIELGVERERRAKEAYHNVARFVTGELQQFIEGLARFEAEHEEQLKSMRGL